MSGDNMGPEQTAGRPPSAAISTRQADPTLPATASPRAEQESNSLPFNPRALVDFHRHRGTFADIKDLLSRIDRRRRGEEKVQESEDQFGADVARIATLAEIGSDMATSRFNESGISPLVFDTPEDILVGYATADERKDEKGKRELRERVRLFTEEAIKGTKTRLIDDIRILYLDRGATQAEAGNEVDALTQHVVNGKRKVFGLLGKDQQMGILKMLSERRAEMLRDNMPHYMYHLTTYQEAAGLTDQQIDQMREDFKSADEGTQAIMSADARTKALSAMNTSMAANIDRLRQIEELEEGIVPIADKLGDAYEKGSLPTKGKILERVLERKVDLSLPHLHDIFRLRRILEHAEETDQETIDPEGRMTKQARLLAEVARIDVLIRKRLALIGHGGIKHRSLGELYVDDMEEEIAYLAATYKDPSLLSAFQKVRLLRTASSDLLDF